jgi:hypothetical protein
MRTESEDYGQQVSWNGKENRRTYSRYLTAQVGLLSELFYNAERQVKQKAR